jgi:hypothetical protein
VNHSVVQKPLIQIIGWADFYWHKFAIALRNLLKVPLPSTDLRSAIAVYAAECTKFRLTYSDLLRNLLKFPSPSNDH